MRVRHVISTSKDRGVAARAKDRFLVGRVANFLVYFGDVTVWRFNPGVAMVADHVTAIRSIVRMYDAVAEECLA